MLLVKYDSMQAYVGSYVQLSEYWIIIRMKGNCIYTVPKSVGGGGVIVCPKMVHEGQKKTTKWNKNARKKERNRRSRWDMPKHVTCCGIICTVRCQTL
jgi:hypothetical protein